MKRVVWSIVLVACLGMAVPAVAEEASRVEVGQEVPDFTLPAAGDSDHTLSGLRGESNALLVFFRGAW